MLEAEETLKKEEALTAAGTALELLGNANSQNFTREKVTQDLNKALQPLAKQDELFASCAPALFGPEFAKKSKEHVEQVKAMRHPGGIRGGYTRQRTTAAGAMATTSTVEEVEAPGHWGGGGGGGGGGYTRQRTTAAGAMATTSTVEEVEAPGHSQRRGLLREIPPEEELLRPGENSTEQIVPPTEPKEKLICMMANLG